MKISKFAPKSGFPNMPIIDGIKLSAINAGISKAKKLDLMLIEICSGATISGLFTKSKTCSAAVQWCRDNLKKTLKENKPIGIIVNSGNANVFTGREGAAVVKKTASAVATGLNSINQNILVASTGVIGELLDVTKVVCQIPNLISTLNGDSFSNAAEAIMTTDTYSKGAHKSLSFDDMSISINGFAKGSGMIEPDMATMLVFIFTDALIKKTVLQEIVKNCNKVSFNSITVDSDTSTSDSLFVIATGKAKMNEIKTMEDLRAIKFSECLSKLMLELAHLIVKDGEGATKFIEVTVKGAESYESAFKIGKSIANSPLVKTAFAGEDPNWGRVVMAIGKAGEKINQTKLSICFGEYLIATNGMVSKYYSEKKIAAYMKNDSLSLTVDLGLGKDEATVWTCDLTHDYVSINADYRS
jgi:glutamate N-acetyltransferase/amino-acid N-acetyltransferase